MSSRHVVVLALDNVQAPDKLLTYAKQQFDLEGNRIHLVHACPHVHSRTSMPGSAAAAAFAVQESPQEEMAEMEANARDFLVDKAQMVALLYWEMMRSLPSSGDPG
ncbi:hypothetical protein WJX84_004448 [Apatococcus fuscideae]|uniref:UspA domain-containing protein n=1 Tax=Apatococcus fuscideae TaxID=2026836 RepID=A0AAW1SU06_9CHLO